MSTLYKVTFRSGVYGLVNAVDGDDAVEHMEKRRGQGDVVEDVEFATDEHMKGFEAMGGNHIYTTREARQENRNFGPPDADADGQVPQLPDGILG